MEGEFKKGKETFSIFFEFFELKQNMYLLDFSQGEVTVSLFPTFLIS